MIAGGSSTRLVILAAAGVAALIVARTALVREAVRSDAPLMHAAERQARAWFLLIDSAKSRTGIANELPSTVPYRGMIGSEWSEFTTTLGSPDAKRTAANPRFAALLVRLLRDAGVDSASRVGITLSGSFPSLAIATLAAAQTLGARAVVISSLGSSSFGANQPGATWLDMEAVLAREGGLRFRSEMVSPGGEEDNGTGMSPEGMQVLRETADVCGVTLTIPSSFQDALLRRMALLTREPITALVNIGGNQTSLGRCPHAPVLPHGVVRSLPHCTDPDRGIIERMIERGVPVIHLLNINALAAEYGVLPASTDTADAREAGVYATRTVDRGWTGVLLIMLMAAILLLRDRRTNGSFHFLL